MKLQPLLCCALLLISTTCKADFTFTLDVVTFTTSGNCVKFGDESIFSPGCETFLSIFCLRGPRQTNSTSSSDCPLGVNNQQIGPNGNSGSREITSAAPWQGRFQLYIEALDDDAGVSSPDHLDNIIINKELAANSGPSQSQTYTGLEFRVTIEMIFRVECSQDFFGDDCLVFCIAQDDDVNGHFTCDPEDGSHICLRDYYGSNCLTFCQASNDETNGFYTCDSSNGSIVCREGFRNPEDFCRENINDCSDGPCHNHGNCTDLVAGFMCECAPGYTGETCSTDINECLEADCPANSTCVQDALNSFACECLPGFEGENCTEIQPCDSVVCENDGTCDPFSFECLCAAGYNGSNCQLDINECLGAVCPQGSQCIDQVDDYMCSSPDPPLPRTDKTLTIGLISTCSLLVIVFLVIILVCVFLGQRRRAKLFSRALRKAKANSLLKNNHSLSASCLDTSTPSSHIATVEDTEMDSDVTYERILPLNREDDITLSSNSAYGSSPRPHRAVRNSLSPSHKYLIYDVPRPSCQPLKDSSIKYKTLMNSSCNDLVRSDSPVPSDPTEQHDYESIDLLVNKSFDSPEHRETMIIVNENVDDDDDDVISQSP